MRRLLVALCVVASGCGGGGDSGRPAATSLFVIGNSITAHGPSPGIGWEGPARGMASSAPERDFAHLTAVALGLPVTIQGFVPLETAPGAQSQAIIEAKVAAVTSGTAVVVELGDNAGAVSDFAPAYAKLIASVRHANRLACVSTWWVRPEMDAMIRAACEAAGGVYVFVGDVKTDPANRDLLDGPQYADPGVQDHPHDWSMAVYAQRIADALR